MSVLKLPDLGEGLQRAEILSWHVAEGDHVVTNQPLVAVETDKAVVDVPAPHAGTIARLCAAVGDSIEVGAALVEFAESASTDTGTVVRTLTTAHNNTPAPATAAGKTTPRVRAQARKLGLDLSSITGTGPGGTILSRDVEQAAQPGTSSSNGEPLRGVRRAMAERMALAHSQVVPASVHDDADVDHWPEHTDITLQLVQAIGSACEREPALNAWLTTDPLTRQLHQKVDLGVAVDTTDGLFVPTLRDITNRSADDLAAAMEQIKQDLLSRSIPPAQLRGQTITLSNFGSIGGRYAELVVVPPQVAIVGAGRVRQEVVVIDKQPTVRRRLPLSLSFDHRAVNGAEATRFLAAIIEHLESPQGCHQK